VEVGAPPTVSEFRGGIIGVTLRPVPGADFVNPITDEHFLRGKGFGDKFVLRETLIVSAL